MTEEEQTILMIKGAIAELPPAQREQCEAMVEHLHRMVKDTESVGGLAIALVGAEMQWGEFGNAQGGASTPQGKVPKGKTVSEIPAWIWIKNAGVWDFWYHRKENARNPIGYVHESIADEMYEALKEARAELDFHSNMGRGHVPRQQQIRAAIKKYEDSKK